MDLIKEMRYWIDKANKLNESSQGALENTSSEIKEYRPTEGWDYIKDHIVQIWDFLNEGYKKAGYDKFCGCDNYKSLLRNSNLIKIAFVDDQWVAVSVYTGYRGEFKSVGITATINEDLRPLGVSAVHNIIKTDIGNFDIFFWTECSGAVERLYDKYDGIKIPNEYVSTILQKTVVVHDDGFHYEREIKGDMQQKIMYGFNNKETFEKVQKEWEDYVNSCISRIMNTRIDESIEKPSFGKLSQIDCAIAIVNFFIDEKWENECNNFPISSMDILRKQLDIIKYALEHDLVDEDKISMAELALENGINILLTNSIMGVYAL